MSNTNLSSRAYDEIINDIVTLNIFPGDSLQERQLADSLEMSRTPVREAISRLAQEGWLKINSRRNIEVCPLTPKDVDEVIEIRKMLELSSIEKAFENKVSPALHKALEGIAATMRRVQDCQKNFLDHDKIFHDTIIRVKANERLHDFWQRIGLEFLRMGMLGIRGRDFSCASIQEEHDHIVNALALRRKKDVRKCIVDHLEATRQHLLRCLDV